MFQMLGVFAEFEKAMIIERVGAGIARARENGTKSGKRFGRPTIKPKVADAVRTSLAAGFSIRKTAAVTPRYRVCSGSRPRWLLSNNLQGSSEELKTGRRTGGGTKITISVKVAHSWFNGNGLEKEHWKNHQSRSKFPPPQQT
jgi:DNA invertase Pin-like site-specific DNA recombinase